MADQFSRTRLLLGQEGLDRLSAARVAVFGLGGVGGSAAEALARAGVGELHLVDNDRVSLSNLNRQILATHKSVGQYKVDAARERILDINPEARVFTYRLFYTPDTAGEIDLAGLDYIVDAVDTVSAKLTLAVRAREAGVPLISSMGTGNKADPTALEVGDIYETSTDPLARVMRRELKKRGVLRLRVVWSREQPLRTREHEGEEIPGGRRDIPGSFSFVPPAAGLILAGEVVRALAGDTLIRRE